MLASVERLLQEDEKQLIADGGRVSDGRPCVPGWPTITLAKAREEHARHAQDGAGGGLLPCEHLANLNRDGLTSRSLGDRALDLGHRADDDGRAIRDPVSEL